MAVFEPAQLQPERRRSTRPDRRLLARQATATSRCRAARRRRCSSLRASASRGTCRAPARRSCAAATGIFNYHDPQGRRRDDGPARRRHIVDDRPEPRLMSGIPNITPGVARISVNAIDPNDEKQPAHAELEPDGPAPTAVEHRRWRAPTWAARATSCCNDGLAEHQHGAVRRDAGQPGGECRTTYRPFQLYGDINMIASQPVFELPLVAEPGEPSDRQVQLHRGLHAVEGARHPRRAPGRGGVHRPTWRSCGLYSYGILGNDRRTC